ncbi:hypothetical protein PAN31117_01026 [Pandoraea anapnoica]|uniref:Uncharacterized protein n=1 Tax=Pandoraea anapnoica TaxID=2508301 RepID=A0A5E4ZRC2_9BURK|nr:hypothetical protein PAN31117_01026 [Pandoraea anapnoica]
MAQSRTIDVNSRVHVSELQHLMLDIGRRAADARQQFAQNHPLSNSGTIMAYGRGNAAQRPHR